VRDQRYVDNGKIITTAGLSSGIDGAFHVIEKIKGRGEAQATALGMEYRWDPDSKFARAALATLVFQNSMESMPRLFPHTSTPSTGKPKCSFPSLLPRARFWNCSAKKLWPELRGRAVR